MTRPGAGKEAKWLKMPRKIIISLVSVEKSPSQGQDFVLQCSVDMSVYRAYMRYDFISMEELIHDYCWRFP